ncbi:MAG: hypothetical protein V4573_20290, partial [Pseudomonadota bacterium]
MGLKTIPSRLHIKFRHGSPRKRAPDSVETGADQKEDRCAEVCIAANASIKPAQVSIEGLARHAVSLHAQQ